MNLLIRVFLLLWVCGVPRVWAEDTVSALHPEDHFRQAVTWYKVARATENSMEAHERAAELYQQVIDSTDDPELKASAERGKVQVEFRIDNAHDTYRTLFDPVWWISGQDTTIEWYDDVYMLALGNAWNAVDAHLQREMDPENHVAVVYVTRNDALPNSLLDTGTDDFEFNRDYRLRLMRDEIIGFAEGTPSITGVPDDLLPIVKPWIEKPSLTSTDVEALTTRFNTQGIVLIHAHIDDEIFPTRKHLAVTRISLSTQFWKAGDSAPYATIKSVGVGQDAKAHHWLATVWVFGVFVIALGFVAQSAKERFKWTRIVFIALTAFFIGGIWSHLSFAFAMDYQVDWGQASLIYEGDTVKVPYLPSMQWSWVIALILLNGPILVLAWALSKLDVIIHALIPNKELQWSLLLPSLLAGAMTWFFMPLVRTHTAGGIWVALPLTVSIVYAGWRIAPLASMLFKGHGNTKDASIHLIGVMFLLSAVFPIGLFNQWHWWVSILLAGVASQIRVPSEDEITSTAEIDADASNPFLIFPLTSENQKLIETTLQYLDEGFSVQILDDAVMGQSTVFIELTHRLNEKYGADCNVVRLVCLESDSEQFSFVHRLLKADGTRIPSVDGASSNLLTESVDNIVSSLPGVDFVMGLLGESASGLSRETVVNDLVAALLYRLKKSEQKTIWLVDNAQFIDVGSFEVLQRVLVESNNVFFVWEQTTKQVSFFAGTDVEYKGLAVENLSVDTLKGYLTDNQVDPLPQEVVEEIVAITNGELEQIKGVLAYLFEQDLLQKGTDGRIQSHIDTTAVSLESVVPESYAQIELERIETLEKSDRTILEYASICGTIFYAQEISMALEMRVIHVLERLENLERALEPSIIYDVPEQPGVFQFGNRLTREVLSGRLHYGSDNRPREFAVQIHRQVVMESQENKTLVPLHRQQYHAKQLIHLYPELYTQSTVQYVKELQELFAWPEILEVVSETKRYWSHFSIEDQSWLNRVNAKALRYTPNAQAHVHMKAPIFHRLSLVDSAPIDNQHASMQVLTLELDEQLGISSDLFSLLKDWCSMSFLAPRGQNQKRVDIFLDYASEIVSHLSGVERLYVESFRLAAIRFTRPISVDLKKLVDEVRQIEKYSTQQYVLGSLLKEYAAQFWFNTLDEEEFSIIEKNELWSKEVLPIYEEADELMLEQQDWEGLATSYGFQGNILTDLGLWEDAIRMLDMDLELVDKNHFSHQKASLHQRLANLHVQLISRCIADGTVDDSLEVLMSWFDIAYQHVELAKEVADRMRQPWMITYINTTEDTLNEYKLQIQSIP